MTRPVPRAQLTDRVRMWHSAGLLLGIAALLTGLEAIARPEEWKTTLLTGVFPLAGAPVAWRFGPRLSPLASYRLGRGFLALAMGSAALSMYNWRDTPLSGAMAFHFVLTVAFAGLFFARRDVIEMIVLSGALAAVALGADGVDVEDMLVWLLLMLSVVGIGWVLGNAVLASDTLSYGDPLTGADDRRSWDITLSQAIAHHQRHHVPLSVAFIDIDHFKSINDTAGHEQGDEVLRSAVSTWRGSIRATDTLARLGGDEFALLLPGCDHAHAREVAERLLADLRRVVDVSCSIGVATVPAGSPAGVDHVVGVADAQLYAAKKRGRGRVCGTLVLPIVGSTPAALAAVTPTVA